MTKERCNKGDLHFLGMVIESDRIFECLDETRLDCALDALFIFLVEVPDLVFFFTTVEDFCSFAVFLSFAATFRLELALDRVADLRLEAVAARALDEVVLGIGNFLSCYRTSTSIEVF